MTESDLEIVKNHLKDIFSNFTMRKHIDLRFWNLDENSLHADCDIDLLYGYYKSICKKQGCGLKFVKSHGMTSKKASNVKKMGHFSEYYFEEIHGMKRLAGKNKTDLLKNDKPFASLKTAQKRVQWSLQVRTNLSEAHKLYLDEWFNIHYDKNHYGCFETLSQNICKELCNPVTKQSLLEWWLISSENLPFLIIWDPNRKNFIRVDMKELIEKLVLKTNVRPSESPKYGVGNKICFVAPVSENSAPIIIMEIEVRKPKNAYLFTSPVENLIKFIYHYEIQIQETYEI